MAENYLITGYCGVPHVTAENDRGINAAMFGSERYVLAVGEEFRAEYIGNKTIRMYDGKLIDGGAVAGIPAGQHIDLSIDEAAQSKYRTDLIVFKYSVNSANLVESGTFEVVKGTESSTSSGAVAPALTQQDILSGTATLDNFALWKVSVSGANISDPVCLFHTVDVRAHDHSADEITSGTLPVERGGTGGTTAEQARSKIGAASADHVHDVATSSKNGFMSADQAKKLDGVAQNANRVTKTSELTNDSGFLTRHQDVSGKLDKSGGTMTGALTLAGDPTAKLHPATKQYVDNENAKNLPKAGGTMTGALVAQNNTNYTTKQVRNIFLVAEGASLPSGSNGDICLVYVP